MCQVSLKIFEKTGQVEDKKVQKLHTAYILEGYYEWAGKIEKSTRDGFWTLESDISLIFILHGLCHY